MLLLLSLLNVHKLALSSLTMGKYNSIIAHVTSHTNNSSYYLQLTNYINNSNFILGLNELINNINIQFQSLHIWFQSLFWINIIICIFILITFLFILRPVSKMYVNFTVKIINYCKIYELKEIVILVVFCSIMPIVIFFTLINCVPIHIVWTTNIIIKYMLMLAMFIVSIKLSKDIIWFINLCCEHIFEIFELSELSKIIKISLSLSTLLFCLLIYLKTFYSINLINWLYFILTCGSRWSLMGISIIVCPIISIIVLIHQLVWQKEFKPIHSVLIFEKLRIIWIIFTIFMLLLSFILPESINIIINNPDTLLSLEDYKLNMFSNMGNEMLGLEEGGNNMPNPNPNPTSDFISLPIQEDFSNSASENSSAKNRILEYLKEKNATGDIYFADILDFPDHEWFYNIHKVPWKEHESAAYTNNPRLLDEYVGKFRFARENITNETTILNNDNFMEYSALRKHTEIYNAFITKKISRESGGFFNKFLNPSCLDSTMNMPDFAWKYKNEEIIYDDKIGSIFRRIWIDQIIKSIRNVDVENDHNPGDLINKLTIIQYPEISVIQLFHRLDQIIWYWGLEGPSRSIIDYAFSCNTVFFNKADFCAFLRDITIQDFMKNFHINTPMYVVDGTNEDYLNISNAKKTMTLENYINLKEHYNKMFNFRSTYIRSNSIPMNSIIEYHRPIIKWSPGNSSAVNVDIISPRYIEFVMGGTIGNEILLELNTLHEKPDTSYMDRFSEIDGNVKAYIARVQGPRNKLVFEWHFSQRITETLEEKINSTQNHVLSSRILPLLLEHRNKTRVYRNGLDRLDYESDSDADSVMS